MERQARQNEPTALARSKASEVYDTNHWPVLTRPRLAGFHLPLDSARRLRLFRAHGLTKKVSRTHRYVLTNKGRAVIVDLGAARNASPRQLTELAA